MSTDRFVVSGELGIDLDRVDTDQEHTLGLKVKDNEGGTWRYAQANGAVTAAGYACLLSHAFQATMVTLALSATARGQLVGFPANAMADNEYGWFQTGGPCDNIRVAASAAAATRLNTTATDGQLDDDATASSEEVVGVTITAANGGAAATVAGFLVEEVAIGPTL